VIGRVRVLARTSYSWSPNSGKIDMMAGFRSSGVRTTDCGAVNAAGQRMMDICAERMAEGDGVAVFPKAPAMRSTTPRCSRWAADRHIACRAMKLGAEPVLVSMALSYGRTQIRPSR